MQRRVPLWALLALAAGSIVASEAISQRLFDQASAHLSENLRHLQEYTCTQTVARAHYRLPRPASGCSGLPDTEEASKPPRLLVWRDRLRVEVAEGTGSEMFSWAGARVFDVQNVHRLVDGGVSGTGDFSSFLKSIFGGSADGIRYAGERKTDSGIWAAYDYTVPLAKSRYFYSDTDLPGKTIGYRGSFFINTATAELERLVVTVNGLAGNTCRVEHVIDYSRVNIGGTDFRLPQKSTMTVLYGDGEESGNQTQYSGCRRYEAKSTVYFGDHPPATSPDKNSSAGSRLTEIPPKITLDLAIETPVDSSKAAAGDSVAAAVEHDVNHDGEVVVHKGDRLYGRLLRFEETTIGMTTWIVTIRFDEIERGGMRQPIRLRPLDDGERFLIPRMMVRRSQGDMRPETGNRPPGAGVFVFEGADRLILDRSFRSNWATE